MGPEPLACHAARLPAVAAGQQPVGAVLVEMQGFLTEVMGNQPRLMEVMALLFMPEALVALVISVEYHHTMAFGQMEAIAVKAVC